MTSENIRVDAQLLTGLQINAITARTWVFDAVKYIAREYPSSCPYDTIEINNTEKNGSYELENEVTRIEKVTKKDSNTPLGMEDYVVDDDGVITLYRPGEYEITYRYVPDMSGLTESSQLPLPDIFCEPIKYYIGSKIRGRIFGQGDSDAQAFDTMFNDYLKRASGIVTRRSRRHRRMPPRY